MGLFFNSLRNQREKAHAEVDRLNAEVEKLRDERARYRNELESASEELRNVRNSLSDEESLLMTRRIENAELQASFRREEQNHEALLRKIESSTASIRQLNEMEAGLVAALETRRKNVSQLEAKEEEILSRQARHSAEFQHLESRSTQLHLAIAKEEVQLSSLNEERERRLREIDSLAKRMDDIRAAEAAAKESKNSTTPLSASIRNGKKRRSPSLEASRGYDLKSLAEELEKAGIDFIGKVSSKESPNTPGK